MEKPLTGKVYDIQGFSVQDGPGIRTTVFFKGCPLRCPWCHSPESQQFRTQLAWVASRCAGLDACTRCLDACPKGAISPGPVTRQAATGGAIRHIRIDRSICDDCGDCAAACTRKALYLCGTDYTVEDLLARVLKDRPFYEESGGGVTLSGGEPMAQPAFVLQLLERLKESGIHTALDTTGHVPYDILGETLQYTDLYLYDLKHMDSRLHQLATGVPNTRILENALKLAEAGGNLQIRIPVIPDFNDSDDQIRETGLFCRSLGRAVTVVQLLPYHNLGVMKHQRIGTERVILEAEPPPEERVRALARLLQGLGLPVTVH